MSSSKSDNNTLIANSLLCWNAWSGCAMIRPMRSRVTAIAIPSETGDFADEVRRVFVELGRTFGAESLAGDCSPPVDIYETDDSVVISVDLPGVAPAAVRIL